MIKGAKQRVDIESFLKDGDPSEFLSGSMCPRSKGGEFVFVHIDRLEMNVSEIADSVGEALNLAIVEDAEAAFVTFENDFTDFVDLEQIGMDFLVNLPRVHDLFTGFGENGFKFNQRSFFGFMMSSLYPQYHPRTLPHSAIILTDDEKISKYATLERTQKIMLDTLLRVAKAYNPSLDVEELRPLVSLEIVNGLTRIVVDKSLVPERIWFPMNHYLKLSYNEFFAKPFTSNANEELRLEILRYLRLAFG